MELVCPAGNLNSLKAAVDNGADAVYMGFRDDTNARHYAGLNFDPATIIKGIAYARTCAPPGRVYTPGQGTGTPGQGTGTPGQGTGAPEGTRTPEGKRNVRVFLAINTYPQPKGWPRWQEAVDRAADLGIDALILADIGVLDYATRHWPAQALHLSVQASASNYETIRFYHEHFGIRRVVLPRVLSLQQVRQVVENSPVPVEVFGFGSLCVMVEGRCVLSSYVSGVSPNTCGACSPAKAVRWKETPQGLESRLGGLLIDRYHENEQAGYPTLCKGRFQAGGHTYYAIEEPTSLNTLALLPQLQAMGVAAIKIEGRQRSPAYIRQVTRVWRAALDACRRDPQNYQPQTAWMSVLDRVAEGAQTTLGAYHRPWQ